MPFGPGLGHEFETQNPILGQEHVLLENIHALDTLGTELFGECMVTVEVLFERSAHDCTEAVGREGTGQHADVAEGGFQRFVQDVTDFVFEVLRCNKRVDEVFPAFAQHSVDFAAGAAQIFVVIEGFPQCQEGFMTRLRTRVEQDADFRVEDSAKGIEQPSVRVDFLTVLLFQAEHHLHRGKRRWAIIVRSDQLLICGD